MRVGIATSSPTLGLLSIQATTTDLGGSIRNIIYVGQTGTNTPLFLLKGNGDIVTTKHFNSAGTAPTLSSCGTTPTIVGGDGAGKVTAGTGAVTSCTVTFARVWDLAPSCIVQDATDGTAVYNSTTVSAMTISGTDFSSDVIHYICMGYDAATN